MEITPVAIFKSPFPEKFGIPRQAGIVPELKGQIVLEPQFRTPDILRGLEGFDYLWLIWGFSGNIHDKNFKATVRPPRLGGNRRIGVFASRSPFRPNPLGLSSVKIESIVDGHLINVLGADLMDGTPIYDIKPYVTYADSHPDAVSGFVDAKEWNRLEVVFADGIENLIPANLVSSLKSVLEEDPRPQYQDDPTKVYGMSFAGHEVKFTINGNLLTVVSVSRS